MLFVPGSMDWTHWDGSTFKGPEKPTTDVLGRITACAALVGASAVWVDESYPWFSEKLRHAAPGLEVVHVHTDHDDLSSKAKAADKNLQPGDADVLVVTVWASAETILTYMERKPAFAGILCIGPRPQTTGTHGVANAVMFYEVARQGLWLSVQRTVCPSRSVLDIVPSELLDVARGMLGGKHEVCFSVQELFARNEKADSIVVIDGEEWHGWYKHAHSLLALSWASRLRLGGVEALLPRNFELCIRVLREFDAKRATKCKHTRAAYRALFEAMRGKCLHDSPPGAPSIQRMFEMWQGMCGAVSMKLPIDVSQFFYSLAGQAADQPMQRKIAAASMQMLWGKYKWPTLCDACFRPLPEKRCPCHQVCYCGTNCQALHWVIHREECSVRIKKSAV